MQSVSEKPEKFVSERMLVFLTVERLDWKNNLFREIIKPLSQKDLFPTCVPACADECQDGKAMKMSEAHEIEENLTVRSTSAETASKASLLTRLHVKFA